jgi:hypothetical protein
VPDDGCSAGLICSGLASVSIENRKKREILRCAQNDTQIGVAILNEAKDLFFLAPSTGRRSWTFVRRFAMDRE